MTPSRARVHTVRMTMVETSRAIPTKLGVAGDGARYWDIHYGALSRLVRARTKSSLLSSFMALRLPMQRRSSGDPSLTC